MSARVRACGLSDLGRVRALNEDRFAIDPELRLYVVADGMGGHRHGEVAAEIAVETVRGYMQHPPVVMAASARLALRSIRLRAAIRQAHEQVLRAIRQDGSLSGMGSTIVGLVLEEAAGAVAHVGDSRAYRWREGELHPLTRDHTWVGEQVAAGYLSEEQARGHPLKNVVTRALGGAPELLVDVRELEVLPGDLYLLCSDGLTSMLGDPEIRVQLKAATAPGSLDGICRRLVAEANARGGIDNVTVVVVSVDEDA